LIDSKYSVLIHIDIVEGINAYTAYHNGGEVFKSYSTIVAFKKDGILYVDEGYSITISKQVSKWSGIYTGQRKSRAKNNDDVVIVKSNQQLLDLINN
jgi:hypothetical protein